MTLDEVVEQLQTIKSHYINGSIDETGIIEYIDDLCRDMSEHTDTIGFGLTGDGEDYQDIDEVNVDYY
tara:strand:+ start:418 stop:621 length:204 start_codon:yes stop_codon:yes gene_type:complete